MRLLRSFNLLMCIVITNRGIVYTSFGLDQETFFLFFFLLWEHYFVCLETRHYCYLGFILAHVVLSSFTSKVRDAITGGRLGLAGSDLALSHFRTMGEA